MFDPTFLVQAFPVILASLGTTLWVAVAASLLAAVLGFALEILRRGSGRASAAVRFLIDFIRSTPILVQIYFFYFVLPQCGVTLPALFIGVFALGLYFSSYLAEVFKAGIDAVPRGQNEAAVSLGLSHADTLFRVVAPQMLRHIAAPMGNYFVSLLKSTPYLAVIAVPEMLGAALELGSDSFRYAEPMVAAEIIFLLLSIGIAQLVRLLELRMMRSARR
ncbi:amino acid ABC transporter permease [Chitinasiproducens palmae]|uniref:Amino acid ABC transporter membrane protein 2, PAAT family n=1 Tax=Chitinasiproducens palmae TaxID=1770053 RepID=A0A1H2PPY2_9BURK|nr:amino acid ABC transporter permease [Chitinasiproducens palmae]SDV48761.1 amino acid ABC transporter membrane protein 2, PAAT family [Chitinasiproducens palmae]